MKPKTRKQRYAELIKLEDQKLNVCLIESTKNYLRDFPDSQRGWAIYSDALFRISKMKEAKKALRRTISLCPKSDEHYGWLICRMGKIYRDSGNFLKAIEWFSKAHEIIPQEATFLIFMGVTLLRLEKRDEAVEVLTKATLCKEGYIDEAFYNLGVVQMAEEKYEEAFLNLKKALRIDSKYEEAKQQLIDVKKVLKILENNKTTK